ncbi:hypothetical protein HBN54_002772 [Hymenobacter sp. 1B]|uniref:Uncharacterized protein n=1 Tax=Hymenobacter artigasi TaxID=2719616 RepID=A0ABX1HMC3_9BACT|nr:hypothetical protein [Hymenobacter artigasi]
MSASPPLPLVAPGGRLSRGALRFRAAHRSLWSRPSHPLRISAATQCLSGNSPAAGQATPQKVPPAPTDAHRPRRPRLRIGATEPSVHSLSPVGRSLAHYGPSAPTLRPVPRSTHPPTPDSGKLQYHRLRAGPLPVSQPATPTDTHHPGPPPHGRPASPHPPPVTRKPQKHRQRGRTLPVGQPAAPTANLRSGPPHSGPSGRTALRTSACRQPVPPFARPLSTRSQIPAAQAAVAASGVVVPRLNHSRWSGSAFQPTNPKPTGATSDSAEIKPGRGRQLRRLPKRQQRPLAELGALRAGIQRGVPRTPGICSVSLCIASGSAAGKRPLRPHKVPFGRMVRLRAHRGPHGRPPHPLARGI